MLCQFCKKREATIHFTNVENHKVRAIHICPQCAEERGFDELKKSNFAMTDFVAGLFDSAFAAAEKGVSMDSCPNCGTSYSAFQEVGRLGCSQCYEFFQKQLIPLLRSIHGNTHHLGKIPQRYGRQVSLRRKVRDLQEQLELAIQLEQFERAAELRDEIRKLSGSESGGQMPCQS
ncbi:MAG: UvrB/UvrC motif-containing protein [Candidatus Krumholzibacteria bacterium]|nr:UvrB/UvrC motif-containing protein [Candidatus Krumholzibacteria bacterium]